MHQITQKYQFLQPFSNLFLFLNAAQIQAGDNVFPICQQNISHTSVKYLDEHLNTESFLVWYLGSVIVV